MFAIRGRPYSGDQVVSVLLGGGRDNKGAACCCLASVVAPVLVFVWNVVSLFTENSKEVSAPTIIEKSRNCYV